MDDSPDESDEILSWQYSIGYNGNTDSNMSIRFFCERYLEPFEAIPEVKSLLEGILDPASLSLEPVCLASPDA